MYQLARAPDHFNRYSLFQPATNLRLELFATVYGWIEKSNSRDSFIEYSLNGFGVTTQVSPVPEPETYALMGLGLVGLVAARRRQRKA